MELDPLGWELAVADGHQDAAPSGRLLQAVGQLVVDDQRVVAPDRQALTQPGEDRLAVVLDRRGLAVDGLVQPDAAAERLSQRLVAEADAERRNTRFGHPPDHLQ